MLLKEFNYKAKITKHGKINIGNQEIIKKIISFSELGHLKWRVPKFIFISPREAQLRFLRGYFDGDGTASGIVRMFSTNYCGIKQISCLLFSLGYKHTLQGPISRVGRKPSYIIQLSRSDAVRFLSDIKPVSKLPKIYKKREEFINDL